MTETEIFKAIESRYGSGTLMAFADLIESENMELKKSDIKHLSWIWERMVNVHGEKSNVDYMLAFNGIILKLRNDYAFNDTEDEVDIAAALEQLKQEVESNGKCQPTRDEVSDLLFSIKFAGCSAVHHGACLEFAEKYNLLDKMNELIKHQCEQSDKAHKLAVQDSIKHAKVEYVECGFSLEWEAVKFYNEMGELFVKDRTGSFTNVNDMSDDWFVVVCRNCQNLYKEIKVELTERELVIEQVQDVIGDIQSKPWTDRELIGKLYDLGMLKPIQEG